MKKRLRIRLVLAFLCMAVSLVLTVLISSGRNAATAVKEVVVAVCDIEEGAILTEKNIRRETVTEAEYARYVDALAYDKAAGTAAGAHIFKGDVLTRSKVRAQAYAMDSFISEGGRLVAVQISEPSEAVSGYISAGDVVSVAVKKEMSDEAACIPEGLRYLKIHSIYDGENIPISSMVLPGLSTENKQHSEETEAEKSAGSPTSVSFWTSEAQALTLIEAKKSGCLHMIFVGRGAVADELAKNEREEEKNVFGDM